MVEYQFGRSDLPLKSGQLCIGNLRLAFCFLISILAHICSSNAADWHKPYTSPQTQRAEVFEFTQKPTVQYKGEDRYEISFTTKGYCDVTIAIVDATGKTVRRVASGVLGANAPLPFQKNSLSQKVIWDGKDDLEEYVKDPAKVKAKVSLGINPHFDKTLAYSPYDSECWDVSNVYRSYRAIGIDANGVYILSSSSPQLRHFDHKGKYLKTILPPSAKLPHDKLNGLTTIEYEPGKHALRHPSGKTVKVSGHGAHYMKPGISLAQHIRVSNGAFVYVYMNEKRPFSTHRIDLGSGVSVDRDLVWKTPTQSGSKDLGNKRANYPKLAFSPDGRYLYLSGLYSGWYGASSKAVHRIDTQKKDTNTVFLGSIKTSGSDNKRFGRPEGIDVDAQGNVYVCDLLNNRIQVFDAAAKFIKSIKIKYPYLIRIDKKRGGIYVLHEKGKGKNRDAVLSRLESLANPKVLHSQKICKTFSSAKKSDDRLMDLDYWSDKPRIWIQPHAFNFQVFEDQGKTFKKVLDFEEEAKKDGLIPCTLNWGNSHAVVGGRNLTADPVNEKLYYYGTGGDGLKFDLPTGKLKKIHFPTGSFYVERAIDARGFIFTHILKAITRHASLENFREVPFDYGVTEKVAGCKGVIVTQDQGDYGNRNGLGANLRGDMAVTCSVYYIPKFENDASLVNLAGQSGWHFDPYSTFKAQLAGEKRLGRELYSVKKAAGRYLAGGVIWTFDRTGEVRSEDVIKGLGFTAGVQIDQDGGLYTSFDKTRRINGKPFLQGRVKALTTKVNTTPTAITGTLIKTPASGAFIYSKEAQIKLDNWPKRPMDVDNGWVKGAQWLYAGVGPVRSSTRFYTDWYKRTFVQENYRCSVGIVDPNGNLIMHLGQYGNADSGRGEKSLVKLGGSEIAFSYINWISATDNYLTVCDIGNARIVVLKIDYHKEELASIKGTKN